MDYIISAATDVGIAKDTNQDSFGVKTLETQLGKMAIAIICDGMGGLSKGEVASATVVDAFHKWILHKLPFLCETGITDNIIRKDWTEIIQTCNRRISSYGKNIGINLGTTLAVIMLTETRYYIVNIGDSRVYEIVDKVSLLTKDQTVVAKELEAGILTEEQAKNDPRRSILLQCIGASEVIEPDYFFGTPQKDAVYMLCSDGFRHEITEDEIFQYLNPSVMYDARQMKQNMDTLIDINKQRQEKDNISVVSIRTY